MDKIKVLAVDDEKFNLVLLKGCLKGDAYEITGCTNAVEALQIYKKQYFDVVLLDILMPGIDGFELRKLIRELDSEKPIIFLTALVDDINTTMLNQISWDPYTYYMNKSFSKKLLSSKIEQAVNIHRSRQLVAEHYQKLETEMSFAGDIQKILLPDWCLMDDRMLATSLYMPSYKVSGDIFEIFNISESKYLYFIGDIAGHGMQAALYMAAIQSFLKVAMTGKDVKIHELMNKLSSFFCNELGSHIYMTCIAAVIDFETNHMSFQSAGHPGLYACSPSLGKMERIGDPNKGGFPIGWFDDVEYLESDTCEYDFQDDSVILSNTDGLFDIASKDGESPSEEMIYEMLEELVGSSDPVSVPFRLRKALEQMGFDQSPDDICVVAIRKRIAKPTSMELLISSQISMVSDVAVKFSELINRELPDRIDIITKVELLVHEYLNNVIIHGLNAKRNSKNRIYISIAIEEESIVIRGMNRGKFWDFNAVGTEEKETFENSKATTAATSGRGLQIMRDVTERIMHNTYCGLNETVFYIKK